VSREPPSGSCWPTPPGCSKTAAAYDNDGWLDLFVANGESVQEDNFLYRNNGDGTFVSVTQGNVATDGGASLSCAWGDYDNDGFLDLIVAGLNSVNTAAMEGVPSSLPMGSACCLPPTVPADRAALTSGWPGATELTIRGAIP
jgi:hypothetical protein